MQLDDDGLKKELQPYVDDLAEIYQDIEVYDKKLWKGKRDCEKRWEAIEPYLSPESVIIDLGSSTGFFTRRIAKKYPSSLVISFECMDAEAELQKKILELEGIHNVVLLKHRLNYEEVKKWVECVDCVDMLIALSVFHHFPSKVVYDILHNLSRFIPKVVAEVPKKRETEACGQGSVLQLHPFDKTLNSCWATVKKIADIPSHLGDNERSVYFGKKIISRSGLLAYWDSPNTISKHTCSYVGGKWQVGSKENYIPGVNVWTLLQLDPIWPLSDWWVKECRKEWDRVLENNDYVSDCRPWNMLFTADGLKAIDYTDKFPKGDKAEFKEGDVDKVCKVLTELKPMEWDKL